MTYTRIRKRLMTALAVGGVLMLCACGDTEDSNKMVFKSVKTERHVAISNENGAPGCSVSLEIACADEKQGGEAAKNMNATLAEELLDISGVTLQQAADSFANSYTRNYMKDMGPLYREDRNDPAKRQWYEYHYNITSETMAGDEGVTIYTAYLDYYEGGAHGINQKLAMNFDNKTGRLLTLADVFVAGYDTKLNEKLLNALMELKDAESMEALQEKGFLLAVDIYAPENFMIGNEAITFIYNPYEIAPYSEGITELTLEKETLEDILKK